MAIGGEVVAAIWYFFLRPRIKRGDAGQAPLGKLGMNTGANPANPADPPVSPAPAPDFGS